MGPSSSGIPCSAEMCWPDLCSTVSEMLSGLLVHSPTTTLESLVSVSVSVSMVTVVWMSTLRSRLTISPNRGLQGIRFTVNRGEVSSCCLHESLSRWPLHGTSMDRVNSVYIFDEIYILTLGITFLAPWVWLV